MSVAQVCGYFGKSRQAYYQIQRRHDRVEVDEELILQYVKAYRSQMQRVGVRKLHHLMGPQLAASGIKYGRDKLFRLLRRRGLLIRRRRGYRGLTKRGGVSRGFPNLVKGLVVDAAEQVWVSDTTAIGTRDGLVYLVLITDMYSKRVMGYNVQQTKQSGGALAAVRMALGKRWYPERQLIHHSDGGTEFYNHQYLQVLVKAHVRASCTAPSSPEENPVAERVNGILKEEFLLLEENRSLQDIQRAIPRAIQVYNELRPHASLDYLTPIQAHSRRGPLRRRWKEYRSPTARECTMTHIGQSIQKIMASWQSQSTPA